MEKKNIATQPSRQEAFLSKIYSAEVMIKKIIKDGALNGIKELEMKERIYALIFALKENLPPFFNSEAYVVGLMHYADNMIFKVYYPVQSFFIEAKQGLNELAQKVGIEIKEVNTPLKAVRKIKQIQEQSPQMWATAKGTPYIEDYAKKVKDKMLELVKTDSAPANQGAKKMDIFQRAELDVRYEAQKKMLTNKREAIGKSGITIKNSLGEEIPIEQLQWTSSHPNASVNRCRLWQGKLFDIVRTTENKKHIVYKIGTRNVYSLSNVMALNDGNSIITGYNCRHHLIDYVPDELPPEHFDKEDVEKQNLIEAKIRYMERMIRKKTQKAMMIKELEPEEYKILKSQIKTMVEQYKAFCEKNGYSWSQYRI